MSICDLNVISIHGAFVIASVLLVIISQAPTRCWSLLVLYHLPSYFNKTLKGKTVLSSLCKIWKMRAIEILSNLVKVTPLIIWDDLELSAGLFGFCALSTLYSLPYIPH